MKPLDVVVIGAGIVGLATAKQLLDQLPSLNLLVLEKEASVGRHQSSHNSGVLHSGVYYAKNSQKARLCVAGKAMMEAFCREQGIAFERCGKVIVATSQAELGALDRLNQRAVDNGVDVERIGPDRLRVLEPHVRGVGALRVPGAGIVDFAKVCERIAELVSLSGRVACSSQVVGLWQRADRIVVETPRGEYETRFLINCAGLHSDSIAELAGFRVPAKIIPFRGEYYELLGEAKTWVNNLIYPVPNPEFPFLGVHLTRMIDGRVECGPNAVLARGREAYGKLDVDPTELFESLTYPGFIELFLRYYKIGMQELWSSLNKLAFTKRLQALVPALEPHMLKAAPAGIRAQAVGLDGRLIDDFLFVENERVINVCNAPSPAATASLAIGREIAEHLQARL